MLMIIWVKRLSKKRDCVALYLSQRVLSTSISNLMCQFLIFQSVSFSATMQLCIFLIWQSENTVHNESFTQCASFSDHKEYFCCSVQSLVSRVSIQSVIWASDCSKGVLVKNHFCALDLFLNSWIVSEVGVTSKWVSSATTLSQKTFQYMCIDCCVFLDLDSFDE